MIECQAGPVEYLRFERLAQESAVAHGIFTRIGGVSRPPFASLNAAVSVGDEPAAVRENRRRISEVMGMPLVAARPVHGGAVIEVRPGDDVAAHEWLESLHAQEADAMMTDVPGFALFWAFADCVPILLYDPRHRAVALVHAGWRGSAHAIAARTIEAMRERYETQPDELLAGVAPSIGKCCYEVSEEVRERFRANPTAWASACFEERMDDHGDPPRTRLYLDLWETNRRQLLAAGVASEHIEMSALCTGCHTDRFFSHRVERGKTGRFGVAIGLAADATRADDGADSRWARM